MASDTTLRCSFWIWLKTMDHDWSHTERRKQSLAKAINNNNPWNQQTVVHRKIPNNSLDIQKKQSKTEIRNKTSFKKSDKMNENSPQTKLSMN